MLSHAAWGKPSLICMDWTKRIDLLHSIELSSNNHLHHATSFAILERIIMHPSIQIFTFTFRCEFFAPKIKWLSYPSCLTQATSLSWHFWTISATHGSSVLSFHQSRAQLKIKNGQNYFKSFWGLSEFGKSYRFNCSAFLKLKSRLALVIEPFQRFNQLLVGGLYCLEIIFKTYLCLEVR